jgi:phenylacetic acid degradation operon negative regulatory protein
MATTSARAVAARPSLPWSGCWHRWTSPPPAVRTAISRMVRQGWLLPVRLAGGPGYQLSVRAVHRLDEAAARIYRTGRPSWDGRFDLVVMTPPEKRTERARITATLSYLGYGRLDPATWVAPRAADEVDSLLKEAGISFERFTATHAAGTSGAAALVRRAWDLAALADAYDRFVDDQGPAMAAVTRHTGDENAYAARFRLVHDWRAFLFRDPLLPPALLPAPWPGAAAGRLLRPARGAAAPGRRPLRRGLPVQLSPSVEEHRCPTPCSSTAPTAWSRSRSTVRTH